MCKNLHKERKLAERRKFKRVELDVAVKCKIIDPQKKANISGEITARAKNLSEGGALLEWPRSWPCDICSNCLGWIYNSDCKLKEKNMSDEESNKDLIPDMYINLRLALASDVEPVIALAKISWVKLPEGQIANKYNVGISFVEAEKREHDIRKKLAVIKKRFETN